MGGVSSLEGDQNVRWRRAHGFPDVAAADEEDNYNDEAAWVAVTGVWEGGHPLCAAHRSLPMYDLCFAQHHAAKQGPYKQLDSR